MECYTRSRKDATSRKEAPAVQGSVALTTMFASPSLPPGLVTPVRFDVILKQLASIKHLDSKQVIVSKPPVFLSKQLLTTRDLSFQEKCIQMARVSTLAYFHLVKEMKKIYSQIFLALWAKLQEFCAFFKNRGKFTLKNKGRVFCASTAGEV